MVPLVAVDAAALAGRRRLAPQQPGGNGPLRLAAAGEVQGGEGLLLQINLDGELQLVGLVEGLELAVSARRAWRYW